MWVFHPLVLIRSHLTFVFVTKNVHVTEHTVHKYCSFISTVANAAIFKVHRVKGQLDEFYFLKIHSTYSEAEKYLFII